jgi:spore coat protein U-like protein
MKTKGDTMKKSLISTIAIVFLSLLTAKSFAGNTNTTMKATASIQSTCSIRADDFSFGTIDQFNTQYITTHIYVKCNNGVGYTIIGDDRHAPNLVATSSTGEQIQYAVVTQPVNGDWSVVFTKPFGTGLGGTITGTGSGVENTHNIYMRIYGKDFGNVPLAAPGIYTDTFHVSLTY